MIFLLANTVFIVASMAYGWLAGDRHDREGVTWIVAALAGTAWAQSINDQATQILLVQIVDVALLLAMVSLALRSRRYWPTWFAGLQFATVAINVAVFLRPGWEELRVVAAFVGTLAILALVLGIFLDRLAAKSEPNLPSASRARR